MLTLEQLLIFYSSPIEKNIPKRNILIEYLQYELLDSIYTQEQSKYLSFMGGTSIRIGYGGTRFSEDLDFDNFRLTFDEFEELMKKVVWHMNKKGFEIEFRFIAKGAYHCYIKFSKLLFESGISGYKGEKILVRIDTVEKEKIFNPNIFTLNKFDLYRNILINPPDIILSQKLITILERKREKGRDFYDVSFLYGKTEPNFRYIEKVIKLNKNEFAEKILKKCAQLNFKALAKDVTPFLIDPASAARVSDFESFIRSKLGSNKGHH